MGTVSNSVGSSSASTGLGAGIDVAGFVNQILTADRAPEVIWQRQQSLISAQNKALSNINTNLSNLLSSVNNIADLVGAFNQRTVSTSDTSILTATADTNATSGTHTILVNSLASTASYYSDRQSTDTTPLQQGTFTLQVGSSNPTTITVDGSNNTLQGLVASINGLNAGVHAGIIKDSLGARLSLVSSTPGVSGDLTISNDTVGLGFAKGASGADASLLFDGVPVTSASNTVSGIIPGLTLQLSAQSTSPIAVTVAPDTSAASQAISDFVSAYNQAVTSITAQFQYNAATNTAGILAGDSTLQLVQQRLFSEIGAGGGSNGAITTLASLGVTLGNDGTLTIDSAKLDGALAGNFDAVNSFFQDASNGLATRLKTALGDLTDSSHGPIALEITGLTNTSNEIDQVISDFEVQLATRQSTLTAQYSKINATLQQLPLLLSQLNAQLTGIA